jgi:hypothetical protein
VLDHTASAERLYLCASSPRGAPESDKFSISTAPWRAVAFDNAGPQFH